MRTHWGSQVMTLMVVLLALAPVGARGQSQPTGVVGSGVVPPSAESYYAANPAVSGRMPLPAAHSHFGYGADGAYAGGMPSAYPPFSDAPPGVSLANYAPYSGAPQPFPGAPPKIGRAHV